MTRRIAGVQAEPRWSMRKLLLLAVIGFFVWIRAAHAAAPTISVQASPTSGAAPLHVAFTASGDATAYHWTFGDGSVGDGAVTEHTYADPGRYQAVVTGTAADGSTAQASVEITAYGLSLRGPSPIRFGRRVTFRGALVPADSHVRIALRRDGVPVGSAVTNGRGAFHVRVQVRKPGTFQAFAGDVPSNPRVVRVRPRLTARIAGAALVGSPLAVVARVRPAVAGRIRITISRAGQRVFDGRASGSARVRLKTSGPRVYAVRVRVETGAGYARTGLRLRVSVAMPNLAPGARGPSVRFLEERLSELHYALDGVDGFYGQDTYDAVIAFQKLHWLERTGRIGRAFWQRLRAASIPPARYRSGSHFEVDKERQVLFDVRAGKVARVIQVSTGATGNTPLGVFHVYDKTPGFNSLSMYYSMYFLRGFAIHGYPFVPPYPASHGCVRVPLWAAYSLYETHPYGTTVIIY